MLLFVCVLLRYMVDAADHEKLDGAKNELHSLLDKPQLSGIPVSAHSNHQLVLSHIHLYGEKSWKVL